MLAGLPARMVYFDLYGVDPDSGQHAAVGSRRPAAARPARRTTSSKSTTTPAAARSDQLQVWQFHVDWSNPARLDLHRPASTDGRRRPSTPVCATRFQQLHPATRQRTGARSAVGPPDVSAAVPQLRHAMRLWSSTIPSTSTGPTMPASLVRDPRSRRGAGRLPAGHLRAGRVPPLDGQRRDGRRRQPGPWLQRRPAPPLPRRFAMRRGSRPIPGVLGLGENDLITGTGSQLHTASRWGTTAC